MKRYWNFIFVIVVILIISCNKDPETLIEPEFITADVPTPNYNYVALYAHIDEEKKESYSKIIQSHGFLISDSLDTSYDYPITKTIDLGEYDPTMRFHTLIKDLKSNTKYYVKAFVKINNQYHYANEIVFTTRPGRWERKAKFPGYGLVNATGFSLNEKGYIVGTIAGENSQVWEYDPATNEWKQKRNAPFVAFHPTSFVLNSKAYIYCSDLWEYDPKIDSWINKSKSDPDFIYKGCGNIYSFVIDGIAYILSGHGNIKWNPATSEWSAISGVISPKRENASSFVLNNKAYIIGGQTQYEKDQNIIEYDFQNNTYRFLGPMLNADGYDSYTNGMVSFVLNGRAYIGLGFGMYFTSTGGYSNKTLNDFYEFDPFMNRWHPQTYLSYYDREGAFQTSPRTGGVSLVIGNRAFIGLGENRSYDKANSNYNITLHKDFWEFIPD